MYMLLNASAVYLLLNTSIYFAKYILYMLLIHMYVLLNTFIHVGNTYVYVHAKRKYTSC